MTEHARPPNKVWIAALTASRCWKGRGFLIALLLVARHGCGVLERVDFSSYAEQEKQDTEIY